MNEFGIYELVPEEESTAEKPIEATPIAEVVPAPEKESEPITTTSDAETVSQPSKPGLSLMVVDICETFVFLMYFFSNISRDGCSKCCYNQ